MGSSDPLPAGFEIRFGSLNYQATGNGYLMRITNRAELHRGDRLGPDRSPLRPAEAPRHLRRWALRALPHLDAAIVPTSVHTERERKGDEPHAPRHDVTNPSAQRRRWRDFLTGSVTLRPLHLIRGH
jgi:hypothetical protein